ncbi:MAG: hypothetical protein B7Y86_07185 [Brevundimonas subvibrioides]|uniref:Uncharacterized protein n=1 Tax=Brevundimonas subvibrioides TaxID=74313 RepID=A0A258HI19_9CAUL|nr:hypothetical protein [Brevundimonas subvibrioides]OYX56566.1 MAG: hypothetical protein B7Y86_07185 [Brevundimonas subvibrioides]
MSNAGLSIAPWRSPADRRRAALLAASVVFHALVLTPLAIGLFAGDPPVFTEAPNIPIFVEMEPRPLLEGETVREPTPASAAARETVPVLGEAVPSVARDRTREDEDEDRPTPPVPRIGASPLVGPPPASADPWQVTPEGMAAAIGRSMRTGAGGCRTMDGRLSASEQQLCDDRFNTAAGRAGPLGPRTLTPSEQRRDAQFARDGAAALAAHDSLRGARSGVGIVMSSPDCPGGNLRSSCAGAHLRPGFEMTDDRLRNNRKME